MMSGSIEKALDKAFKLGAIVAEVSYPASHPRTLTPGSCTQLQRLSLVLPTPRLRCVLAAGILEAEVMFDGLALERAKQV